MLRTSQLFLVVLCASTLTYVSSFAFVPARTAAGSSCRQFSFRARQHHHQHDRQQGRCFSSDAPSTSALSLAKRTKNRRLTNGERDDDDASIDLPDFDLAEGSSNGSAQPESVSKRAVSMPADGATPRTGAPPKSTKSVRELLGDRSLERKMVFDDNNAASSGPALPDLVQLARQQQQSTAETAKQSRAKGSKRKSQQQVTKQDEKETVLSKLTFLLDDKGKISPQKVVEAGTWLGIALLVLWEVYINTPFFDRAAPMAPVVY